MASLQGVLTMQQDRGCSQDRSVVISWRSLHVVYRALSIVDAMNAMVAWHGTPR